MRAVNIGDCAGWLHEADGPRGVIMCGPLGFEDLCSRRSLNLMAQKLAKAGLPVLRFDLTGAGDSAGDAATGDLMAQWRRDLAAAHAFMRGDLGLDQIALVGLRFGGTLALDLAGELDLERLVLMAPVINGHAHLRELSATMNADPTASDPAFDGMEIAGFRFSRANVDAIRGVDFRQPRRLPSQKIFVMTQRRDAVTDAFEAQLEKLGASVWTSLFVGYERMMCDPAISQVATEAVDAVVDWVSQGMAEPTRSLSRPAPACPIAGEGWREERFMLGQRHDVPAVLTLPIDGVSRQVVVQLNAGATPHVGPGRQGVTHARFLAAAGFASLRLDLPGIGDHLDPEVGRPHFYADRQRRDLAHIHDWLAARGLTDVTLMGAGSGAYQALHGALDDSRVGRIVLINPLCFQWGTSSAAQVESWQRSRTSSMVARLRRAEDLTAPPDVNVLSSIALPLARKFARGSLDALKTLSGLAGVPSEDHTVERMFLTLSRRGTEVVFVHAEADPSLEELARALGPNAEALEGMAHVSRHMIGGADHLLTSQAAQNALRTILRNALGAKPDDAAQAA